ncbi:alpha/beta hydrolase [Maribacter sp. TH_r10]|uniref:alpha/beta hydrolase n=1 Tax=Maribacter sp. TH_r10 TaxID=3082086 RepID=UPI00295558EA|nr:lysophospholipase [Maribacter sp. TH_r10]MDV7139027.1 alpha/beta hydrolase [Maribacter sp. TH_r10]
MDVHYFNTESYGIPIHAGTVSPKTIKGVVVLVHGFGEHSGRYLSGVVPMLTDLGLAVLFYDNFGHGKSGGKRGHCPSYEALLGLLGEMLDKSTELFPNVPKFLYGHSMGGNLVLNYALRNESTLKGIVASSPYLRLAFTPPKWKLVLGKVLLKIWPSITMPSGLDADGISRKPEEVEKYKADPLVHDKVSPMFSFPIIDAGEWAINNASNLKIPTLLIHGTADPIIDVRGSEEFYKNNPGYTTLELFEEGFHELHHDLCSKQVFNSIQSWLRQQL